MLVRERRRRTDGHDGARDASPEERAIDLCNGGVMAFRADHCLWLLQRIGRDNAQGEEYLPDVIGILVAQGARVGAVTAPATARVRPRMA